MIEFYLEFASPYAYFASTRIEALAGAAEILWRPILLGPIFQRTGMGPLFNQPMRGEYARRDCERIARRLSVPYQVPERFPLHSLAATRAFYWLASEQPSLAVPFIHAVYRAHWGEGIDVSTPEQLALQLHARLGLNPEQTIAACANPGWKARVREETNHAAARGVFGVPFFFVGDEPFWGSDRLDEAVLWSRSRPAQNKSERSP